MERGLGAPKVEAQKWGVRFRIALEQEVALRWGPEQGASWTTARARRFRDLPGRPSTFSEAASPSLGQGEFQEQSWKVTWHLASGFLTRLGSVGP
jgi:hypothetical protein